MLIYISFTLVTHGIFGLTPKGQMSMWRPKKTSGHVIVNVIFYLIKVIFLMCVQKHIPHVVHFSSWHSNSGLKRYSGKIELF
jgi:hypothetical protein